jgi:hypothetical protein
MTITAGTSIGQRRDPSRIGQIRPGHLVTTAGVGATVDLPSMSVIVRGLEAWNPEHQDTISEPRLLEAIRRVLGPQVRALRHTPWDPGESDEPHTEVGVPVMPFPRWVRCPRCHRLGPLDPPGQFELVHRWERRPDLAKFVHAHCPRQSRTQMSSRRACVPARFLVVCESGHLDDFPYVEYVHQTRTEGICDGPQLSMSDAASTLGPRVTVRCVCGASRGIQEAAGGHGWEKLPECRGRHPHLQRFYTCGKRLRLIMLGASNLWFPVRASALHLPRGQTAGAGGPAARPEPADLRDAEWRVLSCPATERQDADFRATRTCNPDGYHNLIDQVVLVSRFREVRALLGFTRLSAPERDDLQPVRQVPLTHGAAEWVPAVERRGEGIFLQLHEDAVARWASSVAGLDHIRALGAAYQRRACDRGRTARPDFPIARLLLVHTLSHMLIRQVALECGYSSASLCERIYLGTPSAPAAGVLLSTAASDSEGGLGRLVALGEPQHLERLLRQGLDDAAHCSSDPLCAGHIPVCPSATLHAAACHACLFMPEASCEVGNCWLDRAVLTDLTGDGLAFPL